MPASRPAPRLLPARSPSGAVVLFPGWLDNIRELAADLGVAADQPGLVYGAAVDRWGDGAERRAIGSYAAIISRPGQGARLSRSPWTAPPLRYFSDGQKIAAASVSRALHACGLPREHNKQRLADSLVLNLTSNEGWYRDERLVLLGEVVHLELGKAPRRNVWYDHFERRPLIRLPKPEDYVAAADALLSEAIAASMVGASQIGVFLSGGLDSTNVAGRALRLLPASRKLHGFHSTFEPDWHGRVTVGQVGSEESAVRDFATMHPRLEMHYRSTGEVMSPAIDRVLRALDGAGPLPVPFEPLFPLYDAARESGCDVMLYAGGGNGTISRNGIWAYPEFFRTGRWRQLYLLYRNAAPYRNRSLLSDFLRMSIKPLFPVSVQDAWRKLRGAVDLRSSFNNVPLKPDAMERYDLVRRIEAAGLADTRPWWSDRHSSWEQVLSGGEGDRGDLFMAIYEVFGIRTRDVTLHRPLAEFCNALPTEIFMRDGIHRWLAREMGRGMLPPSIRDERRGGNLGLDWHARLKPRLPQLRREIEAAADDPMLADLIDFDAILERIDSFPEEDDLTVEQYQQFAMTIPNAVYAARFSRMATGRNAG